MVEDTIANSGARAQEALHGRCVTGVNSLWRPGLEALRLLLVPHVPTFDMGCVQEAFVERSFWCRSSFPKTLRCHC